LDDVLGEDDQLRAELIEDASGLDEFVTQLA
jgi:hypothetical protein